VQLIPSVPPSEIHSLLCSFVDTLELLEADAKVCGLGEELFALSKSLYPELGHIRRDYDALRQLSDIHGDVCAAVTRAGTLPWSEMSGALDGLRHVFAALDMRLKELPSRLRHWCAFKDAEQHVTQYLSAFPVLSRLSGHFMRRRHWDEVAALAKFPFTYEGGEDFQLKDLMSTSILSVRQDIEGICEEAEMQCTIEKQLSELAATWEDAKLETSPYKKREGLFILCDADQVIDHLHESQLQLQSLLAIRHVMPFRATASAQLSTLSSASDMLELWLKVQTMWVSLQSVFVGSDIARRMPVEAKNFAKADRDFIRLMNKANDDGYLALICCGNPYFINSLPVLFAELERCQKYLDGYLEQTRGIFPRFYFVGSETLLTILSRGSEDSRVMGRLYSELFGSIHAVVHDESDGNSISALQGEAVGGAREIVPLLVPVCAHVGVPVEHWLSALEKEMKSTMKSLAGAAMSRFTSMSTLEFAESTSAQMSLLALRVAWTTQCECALMERNKAAGPRGHQAIQEAYQSQKLILDELMISNLKELPLQLDRIKLEGLIALQVPASPPLFAAILSIC
jgi:dynein heavy chain